MEKKHGGVRPNSGRKPIHEEEKTNGIFLTAIKQIKNVETDDEARIELAKNLLISQRGLIFIAEHLFGKPKETIDTTHTINNFELKDIFSFDSSK
jgi:hypothetical protein